MKNFKRPVSMMSESDMKQREKQIGGNIKKLKIKKSQFNSCISITSKDSANAVAAQSTEPMASAPTETTEVVQITPSSIPTAPKAS